MKAILKPTMLKMVLAFSLFVLFSLLWRAYVISTISDTFPWGFPLQFYITWGPCPPGASCSETDSLFLILDLVFWYLVSGFTVSKVASLRA